jgi:polysaccharide biosynthesis protein PslH
LIGRRHYAAAVNSLSLMRFLLLTSQLPYPVLNGEDLRVWEFAKQLTSKHAVDLVAYRPMHDVPQVLRKCFRNVQLVEPVEPKTDSGGGMKRLLNAFRPSHMYRYDERIEKLVQRLLINEKYDWLWIPAWQMMPYSHGLTRARVLLDVMDDGVLELVREVRCSTSAKQLGVNLKRLLVTYFFERKYFSSVGCCCLVSDADAQVLKRVCPSAKVITVPNGVDSEYFSPKGLLADFPSLIFEGNMSFGPSADAITYFCSAIFPKIQAQVSETRLFVVGRDPTDEVRNLQCDRVQVTGYVDDVRPYLDRASVFVCPMRKGAGIKNKILQAWAMAKPVVATSVATAGLPANHGDNILIADEPAVFAEHVSSLLKNPEERRRLGQRGRETVLRYHAWERQVQLLEDRLTEL